MKIGFSQTAVHSMSGLMSADLCNSLPKAIHQHTDLNYSCTQTDDGWFLKPSFRNMPYINSFVPEIHIAISQNGGQTTLHMRGQPVKSVRIFMWVWFGLLLVTEVLSLAAAAASGLDGLFSVISPLFMCLFGYLLCKTATKATFHTVVKAIQKEFP